MKDKELLKKQLEDLKKKKEEYELKADNYNIMQLAYKTLLNSSYGAFGSVYYPLYDIDIAESTTIGGKTATKEMVRYVNNYMNNLQDTANEEFVIAGDTDSVFSDALIFVNDKLKRIEDVFLEIKNNGHIARLINGTEIVFPIDDYKTKSLNGDTELVNVSRHIVKKERYRISIDDEILETTSDHSIMVYRDGKIIECKPSEILDTDCLIKRKGK